jgi:hypothetical protein
MWDDFVDFFVHLFPDFWSGFADFWKHVFGAIAGIFD